MKRTDANPAGEGTDQEALRFMLTRVLTRPSGGMDPAEQARAAQWAQWIALTHVAWQFQLLETAWWVLWGIVRLPVEALLWLWARVSGSRELLGRWQMWTLPGAAAEHIEARWARLGIVRSQEWMIVYEGVTPDALMRILVAAVVTVLLTLLKVYVNAPWEVIWPLAGVALIYWLLAPAVWRAWLAYLYGVNTWDLRMIVRLCRKLGMRQKPLVEPTA